MCNFSESWIGIKPLMPNFIVSANFLTYSIFQSTLGSCDLFCVCRRCRQEKQVIKLWSLIKVMILSQKMEALGNLKCGMWQKLSEPNVHAQAYHLLYRKCQWQKIVKMVSVIVQPVKISHAWQRTLRMLRRTSGGVFHTGDMRYPFLEGSRWWRPGMGKEKLVWKFSHAFC